MSGAEKKAADAGDKGGKSGGSKKLLLILVASNVLTAGGAAASFLLRPAPTAAPAAPGAEAPAGEHGEGAAAGEKKEEKKEEGHGEKKEEKKEEGHGEKKEEKKPEGHGEKKGAAPTEGGHGDTEAFEDLGPTTMLGSFIVTLNDPSVVRYLKMDVKAEVSKPDVGEEIRRRESQLRDLLISYLSSLSLRETQGAQAKEEIRLNMQRRINDVLKSGQVTRIFITDFVTQ